MISKELFVSTILLIQSQDEINSAVSASLGMVCDDTVKFGKNNLYKKALLAILTDIFADKEDFIYWWLYSSVDHLVPDEEQGLLKDRYIDTPAQLYDFLVEQREYNLGLKG